MLVKYVKVIVVCLFLVSPFSVKNVLADNYPASNESDLIANQNKNISNASVNSDHIASSTKERGFFSRMWGDVVETYNSPNSELYIPVYIWHNRFMWSRDKIESFNEVPGGMGYGKYRYDSDGDLHYIHAMAFLDSHGDPEISIGYAFEKIWRPSQNWRLGGGFTLGATFRKDYKYLPIPVPLPIVSIGYRRLSLEATYIPGRKNQGNVLFTWLKLRLN